MIARRAPRREVQDVPLEPALLAAEARRLAKRSALGLERRDFVALGDEIREVLRELEAEAAALGGGRLEDEIRPDQREVSRRIDLCADALDLLEQVQP